MVSVVTHNHKQSCLGVIVYSIKDRGGRGEAPAPVPIPLPFSFRLLRASEMLSERRESIESPPSVTLNSLISNCAALKILDDDAVDDCTIVFLTRGKGNGRPPLRIDEIPS